MNARAQEAVTAPSRAEIREALRKLRAISSRESEGDGWYGLDRRSVSQYFRQQKWKTEILGFLNSLAATGESITYADICGRADGEGWRADRSYTFSFQPLERLWSFERSSGHIRGDLFSTRDFRRFVGILRQNPPALITFHPVAGLQSYLPVVNAHERIVYGMLESRLRDLIEVLKPGGFIHLGKPFAFMDVREFFACVPREQWESHLRLKKLCREMRCSIEQGFEGDYHCHLIRKWRVPHRARSRS